MEGSKNSLRLGWAVGAAVAVLHVFGVLWPAKKRTLTVEHLVVNSLELQDEQGAIRARLHMCPHAPGRVEFVLMEPDAEPGVGGAFLSLDVTSSPTTAGGRADVMMYGSDGTRRLWISGHREGASLGLSPAGKSNAGVLLRASESTGGSISYVTKDEVSGKLRSVIVR